METLISFFKIAYQNTYQNKSFRDILNYCRIIVLSIDTLLIAFFVNLYISAVIYEFVFITLVIFSTLLSYFLSFLYVYKQYLIYHPIIEVKLNLKAVYIYLFIETLILSILLIYLYLYVKSFYV